MTTLLIVLLIATVLLLISQAILKYCPTIFPIEDVIVTKAGIYLMIISVCVFVMILLEIPKN